MTRGTFYLILPKGRIISSCEFNGDMYGSPDDPKKLQEAGHYKEAVAKLKNVRSSGLEDTMSKECAFKVAVKEFDMESGFEYQKEKGDYFRFHENKMSEWINKDGQIDMKRDTYFKRFFSDYLFWLNLSGGEVVYKDREGVVIHARDGQIATFNFGDCVELIGKFVH